MERMFTRINIDFDKLHGEIRDNLARQQELRSQKVKASYAGWGGSKVTYEKYVSTYSHNDWFKKTEKEYELGYLSARMTVLCSILNYAKGRNHFTKMHKKFSKYGIQWTDLRDHGHLPGFGAEENTESLQKLHERIFGDEWKQFIKPAEEAAVAG